MKQLDNGLMFISSWTPPHRVENLRKLFKRVKRVAEKRGIPFESEIGKPTKVVVSKRSAGAFHDYKMSKESGTTTYVRYQCPVTLTHGPLTESRMATFSRARADATRRQGLSYHY